VTTVLGDVDALASEVHRRTEARALALLRRAKEEAADIAAAAAAGAAAAAAAVADDAANATRDAVRERLARAAAARRARALAAREERLERVLADAARALERAPPDPAALERLAVAAAARLAAAEVTVRLHAAALAALEPAVAERWAARPPPRLRLDRTPLPGTGGGLVVVAGRASVDATVATRLDLARVRLRGEVAALLARDAAAPESEP